MGNIIPYPDTFEDLFSNGMKRRLAMLEATPGKQVNLGSGNATISGADNLDLPDWRAPMLPYPAPCVATFHAYHFFEHLDYFTLCKMLREIERCLLPDGLLNYCVPYAMSPIAFMDASHQTFWTEETMRLLIEGSTGYDNKPIKNLKIRYQVIAGVNSQNLAVLGQIKKVQDNGQSSNRSGVPGTEQADL